MEKLISGLMVIAGLSGIFGCTSDPSEWNDDKVNTWFEKGEWLNGWNVKPDESINRKEFAVSYYKHRDRWDKTFAFLKAHDLKGLEIKRYDIDGDTVYAPVSEYISKKEGESDFEAHRKYIDLQYVINGEENIGVTPISNKKDIVAAYDNVKDIEFMTVSDSVYHKATQANFFIFFPEDIHKPGMRITEDSSLIRKIVVKIKVD